MIVYMYHFIPLPIEIRSSFELPAWPYSDDPEFEKIFEDYMKSLKVFRYEDNVLEDGDLDTNYSINFEVEEIEFPFNAFFSSCAISNEELKIIDWPQDNKKGSNLMKKIKENKIQSDLKAWFNWNVPMSITGWTPEYIRREIRYEYVDGCNEKSGCWSADTTLQRGKPGAK
jgi:hypothetical protein